MGCLALQTLDPPHIISAEGSRIFICVSNTTFTTLYLLPSPKWI